MHETPSASERQTWTFPPAWAMFVPAVLLIAYAIDRKMGTYDRVSLGCVLIAGLLAFLAVTLSPLEAWRPERALRLLQTLLVLGIAVEFCVNLLGLPIYPDLWIPEYRTHASPFYWMIGGAIVLSVPVLIGWRKLMRWTFPPLVVLFLMTSSFIVRNSRPVIDVFIFQQDSTAALMNGQNPYAITFVDPYGGRSPWYGPGLSVEGRLQFGYPYPPLPLLLALPGHCLGDCRFSSALMVALAGALIGYAGNNRISFCAAIFYMYMWRTFWVIEESWTEPYLVFTLSLVVFCAMRLPKLMPFALGLFFVSKQYLPLAAPLALLLCDWPLRPKQVLSIVWKAALAGAVVTLPLALWNWEAFWHSVVRVQMMAPFRPDALSLLSQWYRYDPLHEPPSAAVAFVTMLVAMLIGLFFAPKNIAGFCAAIALAFFAFFIFNKQAFMNYYFFVIGAMCCTMAAVVPPNQAAARDARSPNSA